MDKAMMRQFRNKALALATAASLLMTGAPAIAANEEGPGAGAMAADALVARPIGFVLTTLGAATFVVSLPFSAIGGNIDKAAEHLVLKPGRETFVRCLGCKTSGRYQRATAE